MDKAYHTDPLEEQCYRWVNGNYTLKEVKHCEDHKEAYYFLDAIAHETKATQSHDDPDTIQTLQRIAVLQVMLERWA